MNLIMKRGLKLSALSIIFINFISLVSAQFYSGYGGISFRNFLDAWDPQTIVFIITFGVFFAFLHKVLIGRFFKGHDSTSAVVSGLLAFGMSYGIYKLDFINVDNLFFNLGISGDVLWPVLIFILSAILVFMIWKLKSKTFWILGILMIILSFTEIIYEKGAAFVIGLVLIGIGVVWKRIFSNKYDWDTEKSRGNAGWWFWLGLIALIAGFFTGAGFLIIGGTVITILGLFFWNKSRKKLKQLGDLAGKKTLGGAKKFGGWTGRKTIGKTPLTKGRLMSKKRAEEAARKEEAKRIKEFRKKQRKMKKKLQKEYDKQKKVYQNTNIPYNVRKSAGVEMQKIAQQALQLGINLKY